MSDSPNLPRLLQHQPIFHKHFYHPNHPKREGRQYTGMHASISIDDEDQVLRIHDGTKIGGYAIIPIFNNAILPAPAVPFTPVAAQHELVQNVPLAVSNVLQRLVMVQVYNAQGEKIEVGVRQLNANAGLVDGAGNPLPPDFKIELLQLDEPLKQVILLYL
jgi:hypothetical protein